LSGAIGTIVNKATAGGIPVAIAGTTANPTFAPDAGRIFSGKSPHTDASPQKSAQPKSLGKTLGGLLHH
jgi:hypothetical protein